MKSLIYLSLCLAAAALPADTLLRAACDAQKVSQLAAGIQQNLDIQAQELQGVQKLQALEGQANSQADFQKEKANVLAIQQQGINIRAKNQQLAKELNSPAISGLATVATAQITENNQVKSLTGSGAADKQTLAKLVTEVHDGTEQNEKNLAAAKSQCC